MALVVQMTKLSTGERLPLLVEASTGEPLYAPTVFALTELRARHRAAGTISQALHSVRAFLMVLSRLGVNLDARMLEGRFLALHEIDAVLGALSFRVAKGTHQKSTPVQRNRGNVVPLGPRASRAGPSDPPLAHQTVAIRAHYIKRYIQWLGSMFVYNLPNKDPRLASFLPVYNLAIESFEGRRPIGAHKTSLGQREGLEPEALNLLCRAIAFDSALNPWRSHAVRVRNELMVRLLLMLGIRRGELLSMQLGDLDVRRSEVLIARRPDNPQDPRKNQPNTKTLDRILPISGDLMALSMKYITTVRRRIPGAELHPYLFVSTRTGAPLELGAVKRLFDELKASLKGLPDSLCAHQLRHTWNDHFSAEMDRARVDEQVEHRMRSTLMGWSRNSTMPALYTSRHTRRKAAAASLEMQRRIKVQTRDEEAQDDGPDRT
ncbi:MAG: hypothetical protein C0423_09185 [Methylibium sp.]|nr:hypothetical protein [Methylibium sp.]